MNGSIGLTVGDRAPEFGASLVGTDGSVADTDLSALVERGPVLLTFCALDAAPVEPARWCSLHDFGWFASGEEVRVVGISRADIDTHRRFVERRSLGYPLCTDRGSEIATRYGVRYRASQATSAVGSCFLVDEEMEIKYCWVGGHQPEPERAPPLSEMHAVIRQEFSPAVETYGLV